MSYVTFQLPSHISFCVYWTHKKSISFRFFTFIPHRAKKIIPLHSIVFLVYYFSCKNTPTETRHTFIYIRCCWLLLLLFNNIIFIIIIFHILIIVWLIFGCMRARGFQCNLMWFFSFFLFFAETQQSQQIENSGSSTSSSGSGAGNYGTLGRNSNAGAENSGGAGIPAMMVEMAKTLARRRAASEKKQPDPVSILLFMFIKRKSKILGLNEIVI